MVKRTPYIEVSSDLPKEVREKIKAGNVDKEELVRNVAIKIYGEAAFSNRRD